MTEPVLTLIDRHWTGADGERRPVRATAVITFGGKDTALSCMLVNFNREGLGFEVNESLLIGGRIVVSLCTPEPMQLQAVVRHCTPLEAGRFRIGCEFVDRELGEKLAECLDD